MEEIVLENKTNISIIPRKLDFYFKGEPNQRYNISFVRACSAPIRVIFWGSSAKDIPQGYSYKFTDFRVKTNDGIKYLNTPNNEDFGSIRNCKYRRCIQ